MLSLLGKHIPAFLVLLACGAVSSVQAQNSSGGFWLGGGVGLGSARLSCSICEGPLARRQSVSSLQLKLGGTVSRQLLFGVEANGWREADLDADVRQTFVAVGAVLYWYPSPTTPYYVKAGFGPVVYRASEATVGQDDTPEPAITSTAIGGHFGVGYDLRVAQNISIVPFFNYTGTVYGSLSRENQVLTKASPTLIQAGIGLTLLR